MAELTEVRSLKTEELDADTRQTIIDVCILAHQEEDFKNLFSYVPWGGWHFLAFQRKNNTIGMMFCSSMLTRIRNNVQPAAISVGFTNVIFMTYNEPSKH